MIKFVVKLHPEISVKSRSVRIRFIKILEGNIKNTLQHVDESSRVKKSWDSLDVLCSPDKKNIVIERLKCIPGITSFTQVQQSPFIDFDTTCDLILNACKSIVENKTFSVRVKRRGHHDFTSRDIESYVGGYINQNVASAKVQLTKPQVTVKFEVMEDQLLLNVKQYKGLGGFPIATQDAVISLISGGFDSGVSSYLMMRRGLKTHYLFFNLGGSAHETGVKQVSHFLWSKYGISHKVKFISVDFQPIVAEILEQIDPSLMGIVLKRMMMRVAARIAESQGIKAIVTGEALGQVSSQTVTNLNNIDRVTDMLIVRPLVAMDKQDIIDTARHIGTEDFAKVMPEYCGVISQRPHIAAPLHKVEATEANFHMPLIEQAITSASMYDIRDLAAEKPTETEVVTVSTIQPDQVVLDVRALEEAESEPLNIQGHNMIHIPFFKVESQFSGLDQSKEYLLYCKKGVMSKLQAIHLKDKGFNNVKVYEMN